jgi:16S rRNA processing protein RimM
LSRLEIGGVARAHGIRGEIVIVTHDPDSETLGDVKKIYVGGVEREVVQARDTQRGWLVVLEGVTTRTEAEALRGQVVEVERDALDLREDDVLLADVVGCAVKTVGGQAWGTVAAVDVGEMQDVLVIHDGDIERLIPMVDLFVKSIDLRARVVTIDPPDNVPESKR